MTKLLKIPRKYRRRYGLVEWLRYRKIDRMQTEAERQLNKKGVDFRKTGADAVKSNYGKMSQQEFEAINARQQWTNWLLIGKCLHEQVPDRPLQVLDVGCGTGTSTTVLASYLPEGSKIIANDVTPSLIEVAKKKTYRCLYNGNEASLEFVVQDATKPFVDGDKDPIAKDSLDYLNTSGIVGHHLDKKAFEALAKNATHVVKPKGIAAIDEGPKLGEEEIVPTMERLGWEFLRPVRIFPWKKRGQLLFQLKAAA